MAKIRKALARAGNNEFMAGIEYDSETLQVTHIGGTNANGTKTGWIRITHIPSGQTREHTWQPGEGLFVQNISSLNVFGTREEWGSSDQFPFNTEMSYG